MASSIIKKALTLLTGEQDPATVLKMPTIRPFKKLTERELIQLESEIGRTVFGPVPVGQRREFFNLDASTWIWHEEFTLDDGTLKSMTTRYEIKDNGILKAQDGKEYSYIEGEELRNLTLAVHSYYEKVMRGVYKRDPQTGRHLS